ncbi:MAG: DNA-directed RNA polymerase subunit H [Thermoplasmata archaeon]|nr:MAG: DNA-directed RNA polymerase subunit H [Thermoplasmata archaeon]
MVRFNVLEHELVPEHHILSKEEEERVLKELGIDKSQLPKILITDPCIQILQKKYGKIEEGTVIKIIRKSPTAGVSIAYRVVVHPYSGIIFEYGEGEDEGTG